MKRTIVIFLFVAFSLASCYDDGDIEFGVLDPPPILFFRFIDEATNEDLINSDTDLSSIIVWPKIELIYFERYNELNLLAVRNYHDFETFIEIDTLKFDFELDFEGSFDSGKPGNLKVLFNYKRDTIVFDFDNNPELYEEISRKNLFYFNGVDNIDPYIIDIPVNR